MVEPPIMKPDQKEAEFRLKQLEFLMKAVREETETVDRWARLLLLGNAGGIGTSLIIYKDLQNKFTEASLHVAIILFVVGTFLSALLLLYVNSAHLSVRKTIWESVFSDDAILSLQDQFDHVDRKFGFGFTFLASIACVSGGAIALLIQPLKHLLTSW